MKKPATLIILATISLLSLLGLQLYYVYQSATIKEEQFNESVTMAMCRVADMMCSDTESCAGWESCCMNPSHEGEECEISLDEDQKAKMDSLLNYYMNYYGVTLDYNYEVVRTDNISPVPGRGSVLSQKLDPGLPGEYQLRLNFPGKNQFILSEMKGVFISSVLLILVIIVIFWQTIRALVLNNRTLKRTTDFVNNMTHELNTPIANINLAVSGLLRPGSTDERKMSYTQIIKSENKKLKQQVERLLDISKLEYNALYLRKEVIDLHQLIQSQIRSFEVLLNEVNGKLESDLNATNTSISGDPVLLSNVLNNLLDNALKYSGESPFIRIKTFNKGSEFIISVSDSGKGIPKEERERIFEKYYRISTGDIHDIKGFGLGLTYVKKVIEAHNGSISVDSSPGNGSTFTIKLPIS